MGDTIDAVTNMMGEQLHHRRIDLEVAPMGKGHFVCGHPIQMEQVLIVLISNAMDAIEDRRSREEAACQGRIVLGTLAAGPNAWKLQVSDNGCGVPSQLAARVFQPFVSSKPAGKGTGIGLPIAFGIVRDMGGQIEVASERTTGACFEITLDRAASPRQAGSAGLKVPVPAASDRDL